MTPTPTFLYPIPPFNILLELRLRDNTLPVRAKCVPYKRPRRDGLPFRFLAGTEKETILPSRVLSWTLAVGRAKPRSYK